MTVNREKAPIRLRIGLFASVKPKRQNLKLMSARGILLPMNEKCKSPPIAMHGQKRPKKIRPLGLLRPERTQRLAVGSLLIKGPDLKGNGQKDFNEHAD